MTSRGESKLGKKKYKKYNKNNRPTQQRGPNFWPSNRNKYTFINYQTFRKNSSSEYAFLPRHTKHFYSGEINNESYRSKFSNQANAERESSPPNGSEEYTLCKIQETSDMIKRQLMSPDTISNVEVSEAPGKSVTHLKSNSVKLKKKLSGPVQKNTKKQQRVVQQKRSKKVPHQIKFTYNIKEIHDQIVNHISKMNYGRKQNLINADSTNYDTAIQEIYKQKRLDLSKALREMSHQEIPEASEIVNSIIPDFAIKFEELPVEVIRELSSSFAVLENTIGGFCEGEPFNHFNIQETSSVKATDSSYISEPTLTFRLPCERTLYLNSEDAHSSVVKEECYVKPESAQDNEIIVISQPDDAIQISDRQQGVTDNETLTSLGACPSSEYEHSEVNVAIDITNSSNLETLNHLPAIGSIRVCKNLFENSQSEISLHFQNENEISVSSSEQNNISICSSTADPVAKISTNNDNVFETNTLYSISNTSSSSREFVSSSSNECDKTNKMPQFTKYSDQILQNKSSRGTADHTKSPAKQNVKTDSDKVNNRETLKQSGKQCQAIDPNLEEISEEELDIETEQPVADSTLDEISENESLGLNDEPNKNDCNHISVESHNPKLPTLPQDSLETSKQPTYISVIIQELRKPKDLIEATAMMLEVDKQIEKLTKLRQSLIIELIQNPTSKNVEKLDIPSTSKRKVIAQRKGAVKRRKIVKEKDTIISKSVQCNSSNENVVEKAKNNVTKTASDLQDETVKELNYQNNGNVVEKSHQNSCSDENKVDEEFLNSLNIENLTGSPVICKVIPQKNTIIIATSRGKIQYYDTKKQTIVLTVGISQSPLTCLEYVSLDSQHYIFTGNNEQKQLKCLDFKLNTNGKNILLEDGVQTMTSQWGYFFIGGPTGYLTRYHVQRRRIEFEDCIISEMKLKDLKTAKEGALRILVILMTDLAGDSHIHVRNAMTALHLRTIGRVQKIDCLLLNHSYLYFVSNQEIEMYNYKNGTYMTKFVTAAGNPIISMKSFGNLLLVVGADGIYTYDMKNENQFLCYLPCHSSSSVTVFRNRILVGTWLRRLFTLVLPDEMAKVNKTI